MSVDVRFAFLSEATDFKLDTRVALKSAEFLLPPTSSLAVNRKRPSFKMVVDFHSRDVDPTVVQVKTASSPVVARCLPSPISTFDVITGTLAVETVGRECELKI